MCKWGTDKIIKIRGKKVAIDSCIADLILKLNKLGIKTIGSCCSHGKNPLSILFKLDNKVYEITEYKIKIMKKEKKVIPTTKYKFCNHHHEITKEQKIVDFGSGKFVADKIAIPLLKALNEIGLETRTHHINENGGFVGIMIDNVDIKISKISRERDADRTKYNNRYELLIRWDRKSKKRNC